MANTNAFDFSDIADSVKQVGKESLNSVLESKAYAPGLNNNSVQRNVDFSHQERFKNGWIQSITLVLNVYDNCLLTSNLLPAALLFKRPDLVFTTTARPTGMLKQTESRLQNSKMILFWLFYLRLSSLCNMICIYLK